MRPIVPGMFLCVALLSPGAGSAQILSLPTRAPDVNAASADWQTRSEPIMHAGAFYYPAGPSLFFDGRVMVRTGTYEGVPIYADTTIEPLSVVLVPIGRGLMRPYERRRQGELAGTTGSRTPSFPIRKDAGLSGSSQSAVRTPVVQRPPAAVMLDPGAAATTAVATQPPPPSSGAAGTREVPSRRPAGSDARRQAGNSDVWIDFEGARWFSSGAAEHYDADRFAPAGTYRGFTLYRDKRGQREDTIFIRVVSDGPLAPYSRR